MSPIEAAPEASPSREAVVVIVEYVRYDIPGERAEEFATAYAKAATTLEADEHCLGYEVARGVEEPIHWTVRIEWDSKEGHEQGFRRSSHFRDFFAAVRPFFDDILE